MEGPGRVTLERIAGLADLLYRLRALLAVLCIGAAAWFAWELFGPAADSPRTLLALAALLWALLALGAAHTLSRFPDAIASQDGWRQRWRKRFYRLCYWCGLASFLAVSCLMLWLTVRALGLLAG